MYSTPRTAFGVYVPTYFKATTNLRTYLLHEKSIRLLCGALFFIEFLCVFIVGLHVPVLVQWYIPTYVQNILS